MAPKWQKMASNTPSDLPIPFSLVDGLKKMAPCFCGFNWENSSRSHFFHQKCAKLLAILHLQNYVYFYPFSIKKVALKERIAGQSLFLDAIFFKPSTCEKGTPSSEGMFLVVFCLFGAIFFIFGAIFYFANGFENGFVTVLSIQIIKYYIFLRYMNVVSYN